eukprot:scaffold84914_cov37-Phaeocystis_antarctica.AAC.2
MLTVLECLRRRELWAWCGCTGGLRSGMWGAGGPHCPQCLRPCVRARSAPAHSAARRRGRRR